MAQVRHRTLDADGNVIDEHYVEVDDAAAQPAADLDSLAQAIADATTVAQIKQALIGWVQAQQP